MKKKLFSIIMCILMVMCFMPSAAFAQDTGSDTTPAGTTDTQTDTTETPAVEEDCQHEAAIGDVHYDTLLEAIAAVPTTGVATEITLLKDVTITRTAETGTDDPVRFNNGENVIIDLNGNNITFVGSDGYFHIRNASFEIKGKGIVSEQTPNLAPVVVKCNNPENLKSIVKIGKDVTLSGFYGIMIDPLSSVKYGYGIDVVVNGHLEGKDDANGGHGAGVYVNGNVQYHESNVPHITLSDTSTITATGAGIYAAGYAEWNIACKSINAPSALSVKSGKFNITGGTYTATGTFADPANANNNGSEPTGAAISVTSNDAYPKKADITVTGGTFTSQNGYALYEGIAYNSKTSAYAAESSYATLNIQGGTFIGNSEKGAVNISTAENNKVITGGTFGDPSALNYLSDGANVMVKLAEDATQEKLPTIKNGQKVTLDLNSKTLTITESIQVDGEGTKITVKDSGNGGKLKVTGDYGIYASNGATAVVNSGTIESKYAPLTGNNTTGDMNFEVNGGTLTAEQGPAIYMPGQIELRVTGGTLNGGVSLRMGQVDISGGTFNAITSNIDSPAEYYNYSGNAWLPDAFYVFGGTYTSKNTTYGNSLNLNITGGTFNCTNGQGSALAVYDLGMVSQEMNVSISGDATFNENSDGRNAYDILTLSDIGVTSPKEGYGLAEYVGKISTTITGGTFSSDPTAYLDSTNGYVAVGNTDGNWVVKKADGTAVKVEKTAEKTTVTDKTVTGQTTVTETTTAGTTTTTVTKDTVTDAAAGTTTNEATTLVIAKNNDGKEVKTKTETVKVETQKDNVTSTETAVTTTINDGTPVVESTKKVVDTENKTTVETAVTGTQAAATAKVEAPTENKDTITVDATAASASTETVKAVAVTLPTDTVKVLKAAATGAEESKKVETVELKTDVATLEISNDALKTLTTAASDKPLVLSVAKSNEKATPESTEITETVTFDLTAKVDNTPVFSSDNEKENGTITIKVPYKEPKENEVVKVYYVADDETKTEMTASYDTENNLLTWDTNHFSTYLGQTLVRGAKISGKTVTGQIGKKVTVDVDLTYNSGLGALEVELNYDKTALKLIKVENGTALTGMTFTGLDEDFNSETFASNEDKAVLYWYAENLKNCSGTGTLAKLTFELIKDGTYEVGFEIDADGGAVEVDQDIDVPVTIENKATIIATRYGDVDKSGSVDMGDVICIARYIAKWSGYNASNEKLDYTVADLNSDTKVNSKDLLILEKHIADWSGYETLPYKKASQTA